MVMTEREKGLLVCGWLNDAVGDLRDAQQSWDNARQTYEIVYETRVSNEETALNKGYKEIGKTINDLMRLAEQQSCTIVTS